MAKRPIPSKSSRASTHVAAGKKETGWLKIILILLIVAAVLAGLLYEASLLFSDMFTQYNKMQFEGRYRPMAEGCGDGNTTGCCLASVDAVRAGRYNLTNESGMCPDGYVRNQLRCLGSYSWCEPQRRGWFS